MSELNADLHSHSNRSDGVLTPTQLATRAVANGVQLWALTDHDRMSGIEEARAVAQSYGVRMLNGVEISSQFDDCQVHVVGLDIRLDYAPMNEGLARVRGGRMERGQRIAERLQALGIHGAFDGALACAVKPTRLSRLHFALWLTDQGHTHSKQDAFERYLGQGKPAYVEHEWATLEQAVGWIRDAGGVAVLAHPGCYALKPEREQALFETFRDLGGMAVEVVTGSHSEEDTRKYERQALRYGLMASRGSDFHDANGMRYDLGIMPPLPASLTPVWRLWE